MLSEPPHQEPPPLQEAAAGPGRKTTAPGLFGGLGLLEIDPALTYFRA